MPRHARGTYYRRRRRGRKVNVPWSITYGDNKDDRAENMVNGTVPNTVIRRNYPPLSNQPIEFDFITLTRRRGLRQRIDSDTGLFNDVQHRYVEFIPENETNRTYVYVRSQRYGEIVSGPRNTRSNPIDTGILDGSILKTVYVVTFNNTVETGIPINCSCPSEANSCKHMIAARTLYTGGIAGQNMQNSQNLNLQFTTVLKF